MKSKDKRKLLVVDDILINRMTLGALFEDQYDVIEAENGKKALEMINKHNEEIDVVLLDIVMPELDGFGVLEIMRNDGTINSVPVIMITGENDDHSVLKAYKLGVSDMIEKPFNSEIVYRRVQNVIELYRHKRAVEDELRENKIRLAEQTRRVVKSNQLIIEALSTTVEFRSLESGEHLQRVVSIVKALLTECADDYSLSENRIEIIANAAAVHDIGKVAIPDAILHKPARLTEEEFEIMKQHTVKGGEMLESLNRGSDIEYFDYYYDICRHHHEKWDGRGYPDGLKGDQIPIAAQATGLADVYDALVNERCYKPRFTHEKAMSMILGGECGEFNPVLINAMERIAPKLAMQDLEQ